MLNILHQTAGAVVAVQLRFLPALLTDKPKQIRAQVGNHSKRGFMATQTFAISAKGTGDR